MANVKIILNNEETIEEAKESLFKALDSQRNGDLHSENYQDPAMRDVLARMQAEHQKIYTELMEEVFAELSKEYSDNFGL